MSENITAVVMEAAPGSELTCRAHEMDVDLKGSAVRQGIISYYATVTMEQASDIQSWVDLVEQKSSEDLAQHKITLFQKPNLQVWGAPSDKVIGEPHS